MTNKQLSISVVMCAYTMDRWADLLRVITSVKRQTVPADEFILVIDHNPDLYKRVIGAFESVKVVENLDERGLSGARNSGINQAHAEIVAFIDDDAIATSNWIESLLQGFTSENVMGVGGEVRPLWTGNSPGWFPEEFNWVVGCSYKGLPETSSTIRNPIGCNMSFRREAIVAAGGFRNGMGRIGKIPVGCEETELSIRLHQMYPDSIIIYQPEAVVYHRVPTWRTNWRYFTQRCFAEGLSKAQVTQLVGSNDGLSSERSYVAVTLPRGIVNGLSQTIKHKNIYGVMRACNIAIGLSLTTIGYLFGAIQRRGDRKSMDSNARSIFLLTSETSSTPIIASSHRMDANDV